MPFRRFHCPLPPPREFLFHCVLIALFGAGACSRSQPHPGTPAAVAITASPSPDTGAASGEYLGTVHVIGTARRFILVETPLAQANPTLKDGQALVCRGAGTVTSTLRVSHERRPPFIVADVAAGEPHVGDEVFIDNAPAHPTVSAPAGSTLFPPPNSPPPPAPTPDFRANPALPHAQ